MTRFMQTILLTICCGRSLAEVKKSPGVSSDPTCKAGDADSCEASSEIDDMATLLQTQVRIKEHGGEQTHKVEKALSYESSQARPPHASALAKSKLVKSKLDINQKAYVEWSAVLGDGAGQGDLNMCKAFADYTVSNPNKPEVKVCGTAIKMTVYMLDSCTNHWSGMAPTWEVGSCDTSQPPSSCESFSPSDDASFGAAQSYKITECQ